MENTLHQSKDIENYLPAFFAKIRVIQEGQTISPIEKECLKSNAKKLMVHFLSKKEAAISNYYYCIDEIDANLDLIQACISALCH